MAFPIPRVAPVIRAVLLLKDIVEGLDKVILENWVDKCFERKGSRLEVRGSRLEVRGWRLEVGGSMFEVGRPVVKSRRVLGLAETNILNKQLRKLLTSDTRHLTPDTRHPTPDT